jgi:hypothetical protein
MKRNFVLGFLLFSVLSCAAQNTTSTQGLTLYDNFNHRFLDPSKWSTGSACFTTNGLEEECVRQIQNGRLHLAHRNYGNRDTNTGFQFGDANVVFAHPSRIKSITTDVTVVQTVEVPCLANPEFGAQAQIDATFFNIGSGNPNDDVAAHLAFGHNSTTTVGQTFVFGQISRGNNYFGYTALGNVPIGTTATASLTWDQPNHQFLVSWTNPATNVKTEASMPYTFADTAPATNASKDLSVNTFPANCTASPASVFMEATFDNVYINPNDD